MQQLLLRAVVLLALGTPPVAAQATGGMDQKGEAMARQMDTPKRSKTTGMSRSTIAVSVSGVDGHRASGMVRFSREGMHGERGMLTLDASFAVSDALGAGLYLSTRDTFDTTALRVAMLARAMGEQSYDVHLPPGSAPRFLLVVNDSSHAVLAKASLRAAMK